MNAGTAIQIALKADLMRSDLVQGLVWFVNYAALDPTAIRSEDLDLHGCGMLPEDVEKFAHRWLAFSRSVDIEHDGIGRPVHVIESFFNGPDINSSAWPVNAHATRLDVSGSAEAMDGLKTGKLNSVSLDAFTFNKVVRLPVAEAKAALGISSMSADSLPKDLAGWAQELAQRGYEGVGAVNEIAPGLFMAQRSHGMPLAVSFKDGLIDVTAAGGAWGHIAATLMESPTLTKKDLGSGDYTGVINQPVDYSPWDQSAVIAMLQQVGINLDPETDTFQELEDEFYAWREPTTQKGHLMHHTRQGNTTMVSKDAVMKALSELNSVPEAGREAARKHLMAHLDDITRRELT